MTLIERSQQFGYDVYGSRTLDPVGVGHVCRNLHKPRDAADFVKRKNEFYQSCHNSNVHYDPIGRKKSEIFATVPK